MHFLSVSFVYLEENVLKFQRQLPLFLRTKKGLNLQHVDLHFKKSPAPRGGSGHKACFLFSRVRGTRHYITQIRAQTEARLLENKKGTECRVKSMD